MIINLKEPHPKAFYDDYIEELQDKLGEYKVPKLITELINFDYTIDGEYYHERFQLRMIIKNNFIYQ